MELWSQYGGYIVISATIAFVVPLLIFGWFRYKSKLRVDDVQFGLKIQYFKGALRPWDGYAQAANAITRTWEDRYPQSMDSLKDVLVVVVPYEGVVWGIGLPKSKGRLKSNHDGEMARGTPTGATAVVRLWGILRPRYLLVIRQLKDMSGKPRLLPASSSALFHEAAEHWTPFVLGLGFHPVPIEIHDRGEGPWHALKLAMREQMR